MELTEGPQVTACETWLVEAAKNLRRYGQHTASTRDISNQTPEIVPFKESGFGPSVLNSSNCGSAPSYLQTPDGTSGYRDKNITYRFGGSTPTHYDGLEILVDLVIAPYCNILEVKFPNTLAQVCPL